MSIIEAVWLPEEVKETAVEEVKDADAPVEAAPAAAEATNGTAKTVETEAAPEAAETRA